MHQLTSQGEPFQTFLKGKKILKTFLSNNNKGLRERERIVGNLVGNIQYFFLTLVS